ncbi:hypothetical protein OIU74_004748, partial [Salix koriyanagi]
MGDFSPTIACTLFIRHTVCTGFPNHISASSPPLVSQAYYAQFQEDFSLFLRSRSEELTAGGRMVL